MIDLIKSYAAGLIAARKIEKLIQQFVLLFEFVGTFKLARCLTRKHIFPSN